MQMNTTSSVCLPGLVPRKECEDRLEEKYLMTSYSENIQATLEIFSFLFEQSVF